MALGSTLPQVTDTLLIINGPVPPGIKIDGGGSVQVMSVVSGARVNLNGLTIANGGFGGGGSAGGIYNLGTLTVTNSIFSGNDAAEGGGIANGGTLTVTNSTFSNNNAAGGAGISNFGTLTITNSTFSGNDAAEGGGIDNYDTLMVTNSTFSDNTGAGGFSGIYNEWSASVKSTIMAASSCAGTITDAGYNISDDASCAFSATGSHNSTIPMLDPNGLRNNGGPTQTIALLPGSPAIDAIPLAHCTDQALPPNPIITDQRLFPRPDAGESACDIGAYELQDSSFIPFSRFGGGTKIDPDAGVFYLSGGFKLGLGGSIDPTTQPTAFSVGSYAIRLPAGAFVKYNTGYVYQKRVNGIFLCIFIKFSQHARRLCFARQSSQAAP